MEEFFYNGTQIYYGCDEKVACVTCDSCTTCHDKCNTCVECLNHCTTCNGCTTCDGCVNCNEHCNACTGSCTGCDGGDYIRCETCRTCNGCIDCHAKCYFWDGLIGDCPVEYGEVYLHCDSKHSSQWAKDHCDSGFHIG